MVICSAHACARALPWHKCRGVGSVCLQSKGLNSHQKEKLRIVLFGLCQRSQWGVEKGESTTGELLLLNFVCGLWFFWAWKESGRQWEASFLSLRNNLLVSGVHSIIFISALNPHAHQVTFCMMFSFTCSILFGQAHEIKETYSVCHSTEWQKVFHWVWDGMWTDCPSLRGHKSPALILV